MSLCIFSILLLRYAPLVKGLTFKIKLDKLAFSFQTTETSQAAIHIRIAYDV